MTFGVILIFKKSLAQVACFADLDMCQYGMHSMQDGRPLKKPLSLMTNSFDFVELMHVKCKEETHNH